jgi:hypothetical protein
MASRVNDDDQAARFKLPDRAGAVVRGGRCPWRVLRRRARALGRPGRSQTYEFFFEGTRLSSISFSNGAGKYTGSEIPTSIDEIRVGWNNYQSAPPGFTAWIDDVALDVARIGCN